MHWLTKFFVVLAAVLSVGLSALTVTYSVNADRLADALTEARQAELAATTARRLQEDAHAAAVASLRSELDSLTERLAAQRIDLRQLEQDKVALEAELREAEAARTAVQGQVTQSQVSVQTLTQLVDTLTSEVNTLRDAAAESRNQRLDLEDRLADAVSENQVFQQNLRALQEQLAEAQRALAQAETGGVRGGASATELAGEPRPLRGPTVVGRVEDVRFEGASERTLVQVNLGRNDGLQPNTELYVVRGPNYVGTIVVDRVDLQTSVGHVRLTNQGFDIRQGDEVRSRIVAQN